VTRQSSCANADWGDRKPEVAISEAYRNLKPRFPTEVKLDQGDGMPELCALSFDNITTMPKALLTEQISRLSVAKLEEACRALRATTAC
jgi:mRNA-degrading endonuclease toxin of MazEF toxin-antitoxin module